MTTLAVGGLNPFWEFLPWPGFDFELDLNSEFLAFKDRRRLHWKWQWSPSWSSWSTHKYFSLFSHRIGAKSITWVCEWACVPVHHTSLPVCTHPILPVCSPSTQHQHKQTCRRIWIWSGGQLGRILRYEQRSNGQVKVIVMSCKWQPPDVHTPFGILSRSDFPISSSSSIQYKYAILFSLSGTQWVPELFFTKPFHMHIHCCTYDNTINICFRSIFVYELT